MVFHTDNMRVWIVKCLLGIVQYYDWLLIVSFGSGEFCRFTKGIYAYSGVIWGRLKLILIKISSLSRVYSYLNVDQLSDLSIITIWGVIVH